MALDPNLVLAAGASHYESPQIAQSRALQIQQQQQAVNADAQVQALGAQQLQLGSQHLQLGAQDLQAKTYAYQEPAAQLASQQALQQGIKDTIQRRAAVANAALPVAPSSPSLAPAPGVTYPTSNGMTVRDPAFGQAATPMSQVLPGMVGVAPNMGTPAGAAAPAPSSPAPARPADTRSILEETLDNAEAQGTMRPSDILSARALVLSSKQKMADLLKTQDEIRAAQDKHEDNTNDLGASMANRIALNGYKASDISIFAHHARDLGHKDIADQLDQATQNPDLAKQIIDGIRAHATDAGNTANSKVLTAETAAQKFGAEQPGIVADNLQKTRLQAAQTIAAQPDMQSAQAEIQKLLVSDPDTAKFVSALVDPQDPNWRSRLLSGSLNADQQTTAGLTANRDANTVANDAALRQQGNARIGLEAQANRIRTVEADPFGQLGLNGNAPKFTDPNGQPLTGQPYLDSIAKTNPGLAASIKAAASGQNGFVPRGKEGEQWKQMVYQYDPTANDQRIKMRNAFAVGKQGVQIGNLNTAAVHADQAADIFDAMKNGSFQPGNQAYNYFVTKFGSAAATNYNTVKTALAGEMASALKGNATDPEIAHVLSTLNTSGSPAQASGALRTNLHVLGAKLNTFDEQYHQTVGKDDPWSPVLPAARAVFNKNGIRPLASDAAPKKNPFRQ